MTKLTVTTAVAALLVAAPLTGAFAQQLSPEDYAYTRSIATNVDSFTTSSINNAPSSVDASRLGSPADAAYRASVEAQRTGANSAQSQGLDSRIKAAEANLGASRQNGYVNATQAAHIRGQLAQIRSEAAAGGSHATLAAQLNSVNQSINALNGG